MPRETCHLGWAETRIEGTMTRAQQERSSHKAGSMYTDTDADAKDTQYGLRVASPRDPGFLEYGEHPAMVPISKDLSINTTVTYGEP